MLLVLGIVLLSRVVNIVVVLKLLLREDFISVGCIVLVYEWGDYVLMVWW